MEGNYTFSADGRTLGKGSEQGNVLLWDLASQNRVTKLVGGQATVSQVIFAHSGAYVGNLGRERADGGPLEKGPPSLRVWHRASGQFLPHLGRTQGEANAAWFSPDDRLLAVLHTDRTLRLWEVVTGKERCRLASAVPDDALRVPPLFTPDGRRLLTADGATVLLWDLTGRAAEGEVVHEEE
jgi:WD40 repeat protein